MRLALIAALQYLPARQRAVLILRDVLQWRAAEVAGLLGTTTTAVNSMLQRAREQLSQLAPAQDEIREPDEPAQRRLLDQYAAAFQNADVAALAQLLRDDAVLEMPPMLTWFAGRDQIARFLATQILRHPGQFTLIPISANGQPGFAEYLRGRDGVRRAFGLQVITATPAGIAHVVVFVNQPELFPLFGLPAVLPPAAITAGHTGDRG